MKPRFEFQSELDYKLHSYEERINFAKYQITSQLKDAYKRRNEENLEWKLWSSVMIAIIVCLILSIFMSNSVSFLVIPGVLLMFVSVAATIFILPICIYKIIKGTFMWAINKENKLGKWLVEKCEIPTQRSEIVELQTHLNRYNLMLEDIARYREEMAESCLSVEEKEIYNRFDKLNYKPEIPVISENCAKLMKFIKKVSTAIWLIFFALILWGVWTFASYMLTAYWNMYRQLLE